MLAAAALPPRRVPLPLFFARAAQMHATCFSPDSPARVRVCVRIYNCFFAHARSGACTDGVRGGAHRPRVCYVRREEDIYCGLRAEEVYISIVVVEGNIWVDLVYGHLG